MSDLQTKLVTQDILERSLSQPVYLSSIEVVGGETFSSNFFKKVLAPLTEKSDYTLGQLLQRVDLLYSRLMKTDVFQRVDMSLHADYAKLLPPVTSYNHERSIPTKVVIDLSSIALNSGAAFLNLNSDHPLSVNLNYLNNNFFENAEIINLGVDYNPYKPNQHLISNGSISLSLPNPSFKLVGDFYNTTSNNQLWQHLQEHTTGIFTGLRHFTAAKQFQTIVGLGLAKRTLHDIDASALDELKEFAGESLKKSVIHQSSYTDLGFLNNITRNFPTRGVNLLVSNELSANEGAAKGANDDVFWKLAISTNVFKSFFHNALTTQLLFDVGGIFQPRGSRASVHTSDRFYLGGYNLLRGFSKNAVNTDGGYQFYKVGATVYAKFPKFVYRPATSRINVLELEDGRGFEANPLRMYLTASAGQLSSLKPSLASNVFADRNVATSAGVGVRYFNNWANFDIGYYLASRAGGDTRGVQDGFQFSVSIGGSNKSL